MEVRVAKSCTSVPPMYTKRVSKIHLPLLKITYSELAVKTWIPVISNTVFYTAEVLLFLLEEILGQKHQIPSSNTFWVPPSISHRSLCLHEGCAFVDPERLSTSWSIAKQCQAVGKVRTAALNCKIAVFIMHERTCATVQRFSPPAALENWTTS